MGNDEMKAKNDLLIQNVKESKTINEHKRAIHCLLQLENGDYASCSDDRRINIYSNKDFKLKQKIKEHEHSVTYIFKMENNQILSSSEDETIKIIKLTDNNTKYTLIDKLTDNHDFIIQSIEISNGNIISLSSKRTLKFYQLNNNKKYECFKVIDKSGVNFLFELPNKTLISASYLEKNIKFWNIENYSVTQMMNNISIIKSMELMCMLTDNLLGIAAEKFYVIDIENKKLIKKIQINNGNIQCVIKLNNNTLLFGIEGEFSLHGNNYHFNQYKLNEKGDNLELISIKEKVHNTGINYMIQGKNGEIISCSEQRIKVWK